MQKKVYASALLLMLMLSVLALFLVIPINADQHPNNPRAEKAEKILWIADRAKRRVEVFINLTLTNETIIVKIESAGLNETFYGNLSLFEDGTRILEEAHEYFETEDYGNATAHAMQALRIFRDVFRNINHILSQANVERGYLIDGQGLIEAMNRALARIERIENFSKSLSEKGVDVADVLEVLDEAKQYLNVIEAMELLQQGNVSAVAHRLAEANKLIAQASRMLREKTRELIADKVKRHLERIRKKIMEKLQGMNVSESVFFKHWNFTNAEEFWRKQMEIAEKIKEHVRKGKMLEIVNDLRGLGRRMREIQEACLELEIKLQHEGEGEPAINVTIEKTIELKIARRATVTLKITIRNVGNTTLIFPNSAFGIVIEKEKNGKWIFYHSPILLPRLQKLDPGEEGEIEIRLKAASFGRYRILIIREWSETGLQIIGVTEFTIP